MYPLFFLLSSFCLFAFSYGQADETSKPVLFVSVQPYLSIVQDIGGDSVVVQSVVSSAISSHTFEATPKTTMAMQNGMIWFGIGEPFEKKLIKALKGPLKSNIHYVNLKNGIAEELKAMIHRFPSLQSCCSHTSCSHEHHHHGHHHDHELQNVDPHLWMSPILMKLQIRLIAEEIKRMIPSINHDEIDRRTELLIAQTEALQEKAQKLLGEEGGKSILTAHPAYGYLVAPFGILQYAIEEEGKEPSPKALTQLIQLIHNEKIDTIFTQSQYPSKGAEVLASQVMMTEKKSPHIIQLDPYSKDYFTAMNTIIDAFHTALENQNKAVIKE